jgi:hypothetical protein
MEQELFDSRIFRTSVTAVVLGFVFACSGGGGGGGGTGPDSCGRVDIVALITESASCDAGERTLTVSTTGDDASGVFTCVWSGGAIGGETAKSVNVTAGTGPYSVSVTDVLYEECEKTSPDVHATACSECELGTSYLSVPVVIDGAKGTTVFLNISESAVIADMRTTIAMNPPQRNGDPDTDKVNVTLTAPDATQWPIFIDTLRTFWADATFVDPIYFTGKSTNGIWALTIEAGGGPSQTPVNGQLNTWMLEFNCVP